MAHVSVISAHPDLAAARVQELAGGLDNAVVNVSVLERMSRAWQRTFLTVGVLITVFGMRMTLPLAIVAVASGIDPVSVLNLAINEPAKYLERPLAQVGAMDRVGVLVALLALVGTALGAGDRQPVVLLTGMGGLMTYLAVNGLADLFAGHVEHSLTAGAAQSDPPGRHTVERATGRAAMLLFVYLEVRDASFSFDGLADIHVLKGGLLVPLEPDEVVSPCGARRAR